MRYPIDMLSPSERGDVFRATAPETYFVPHGFYREFAVQRAIQLTAHPSGDTPWMRPVLERVSRPIEPWAFDGWPVLACYCLEAHIVCVVEKTLPEGDLKAFAALLALGLVKPWQKLVWTGSYLSVCADLGCEEARRLVTQLRGTYAATYPEAR